VSGASLLARQPFRLLYLEQFTLLAQPPERFLHPLQQCLRGRRADPGSLQLHKLAMLPTDLKAHSVDFHSNPTKIAH